MENGETKQCPYCAETVLKAAIRCKHCGGDIGGGASILATKKSEALGVLMLTAPFVAALLIVFWVGDMALIQNPGSTLNLLAFATVIGTAILVAIEAKQVGAGNNVDLTPKGKKRSGPGSWFAVTLLLWVVGFPGWLYQRKRYGLKNLVVGGIVAMTFFVGSFAVMNATIERKKDEIREKLAGITRTLQQSSPQPEQEVARQQAGNGEPVAASDPLQFGKPAVMKSSLGMTGVKVMAKNVSGKRISECIVTATFVKGDTILGTAQGFVRNVAPGFRTTAQLWAQDVVKGYDTISLETTTCD
jgi:hypothetical protein